MFAGCLWLVVSCFYFLRVGLLVVFAWVWFACWGVWFDFGLCLRCVGVSWFTFDRLRGLWDGVFGWLFAVVCFALVILLLLHLLVVTWLFAIA